MIERIDYVGSLGSTHALIFNEPFDDYYSLLLEAATTDNKLQDNYKNNILKNKNTLFGYILYHNEDPGLMYFVEKDPSLPDNVARCFVRFFIAKKYQQTVATSTAGFWKQIYSKEEGLHCRELFLFKDRPDILKTFGIDTVFFTRNEGTRDKWLARQVKPAGFKQLEEPRKYRGVYQNFYVCGDDSFVNSLETK